MKIKNILLKKKTIDIKEILSRPNMHIDFHREDYMPEADIENHFDCVIELSLSIKDGEKKDILVEMVVSFVVFVELEEKEKYSRQLSNKVYNAIEILYQKTVNDLLKEANYPPVPITIQTKAP